MFTYTVNVSLLGQHFCRVEGLTTEVRAHEVAATFRAGFAALQVKSAAVTITRWTVPVGEEVPVA